MACLLAKYYPILDFLTEIRMKMSAHVHIFTKNLATFAHVFFRFLILENVTTFPHNVPNPIHISDASNAPQCCTTAARTAHPQQHTMKGRSCPMHPQHGRTYLSAF